MKNNNIELHKKNWLIWIAIFLISASLILLQGALTRILSASSDYHATFFVISAVMLGLSVSSIKVFSYVKNGNMSYELVNKSLIRAGIYVLFAYIIFSHVLMRVFIDDWTRLLFIVSSFLFYFPFERCGFAIAGILYLEKQKAGWIYWGDLLGASIAAALLVPIFNFVSSPLVFILCSFILMLSSSLVGRYHSNNNFVSNIFLVTISLFFLACIKFPSLVFLPFPHSYQTESLLWEKWNSQARVAVFNESSDITGKYVSAGWGITKNFTGNLPTFKWLNIDSGAGTQIIGRKSQNDIDQLEYLKWDITAAAYQLKNQSLDKVFIIGGGGGRDIVTASVFGAKEINVAELNPLVKEAANEVFGEFSSKPYSIDNVKLTMGEGRNVISRSQNSYNLIQMSMIDTFAASVAGSFALTENSLYTVEAFKLFISKLTDDGVFSLSRWWLGGARGETARSILMLLEGLKQLGYSDPSKHILVLYSEGELSLPITTMLTSKVPFSDSFISKAKNLAQEKGFEVLWPNVESSTRGLSDIFNPNFDIDSENIHDLSLSTDDRPFFFNSKKVIGSWIESFKQNDISIGSNTTLIFMMTILLIVIGSRYLVYLPAMNIISKLNSELQLSSKQTKGLFFYFSSIGIGFMLVEVAMLQRFSIFLGHPHLSLSVVLFCVLFFSSFGSFLSNRILNFKSNFNFVGLLSLLLIDILFKAFLMPDVLKSLYSSELSIRILLTGILIAPGSLIMGMFLPFGFSILNEKQKGENVPLAWAVNGISSVIGSALGAMIAMTFGYTYLLIVSAITYSFVIFGFRLIRS